MIFGLSFCQPAACTITCSILMSVLILVFIFLCMSIEEAVYRLKINVAGLSGVLFLSLRYVCLCKLLSNSVYFKCLL